MPGSKVLLEAPVVMAQAVVCKRVFGIVGPREAKWA